MHHLKVTAANVHDVTETSELLGGEEETVYGDSGYMGAEKREEAMTRNKQGKKVKYIINRRPSQIDKLSRSGQWYAKKRNTISPRYGQKWSMSSAWSKVCSGIEKRDTVVCESRLQNFI